MAIVLVCVTLIVDGNMTFDEVPRSLKEKVKARLIEIGMPELAEPKVK